MEQEVAKALNEQSRMIQEVKKQLDDYIVTLHGQSSSAIDDIVADMLKESEAK